MSKILYDKNKYPEYQFFDSVLASVKVSDEKLAIEDIGDDSVCFNNTFRKVSDLVAISSVPSKYGKLLFRMVRYYKPASIVELGTSIGISTVYLAKGETKSKILTIEGNNTLSNFASGLFSIYNLKNIDIQNSDFDEVIDDLSVQFSTPGLVFIDGNHKYEPTMKYYKHFIERMNEGMIIIDDIYWSAGMRHAWKEIIKETNEYVTIDLYRMGIILIRKLITPGHYIVRF